MLHSNHLRLTFYTVAFVIFALGAVTVAAQKKEGKREFCTNNWNWSDNKHVSTSELRETTIAGGSLNVDGKKNGGITVIGENRADVLVRACVQAWAYTDEDAKALAKSIRIETSGSVRAESSSDEFNWGVSYEIHVPRNTNLNLTTENGGIVIDNVDGEMNFNAKNGGIRLSNLAGDVKGKTTNGGVNVDLEGDSWKGSGLDVQTTNGGVKISMSRNYAAKFETGTVNGGFSSTIPGVQREKESRENGWQRPASKVTADLNGGGAPIRIVTTNGGVRIDSN